MRSSILAMVLVGLGWAAASAETPVPTYKKLVLSDKFTCEGAYYADFNKDGKLDVVAGPFWFEGPDFQKRHEFRQSKVYDPKGYSDCFLVFAGDFNGDGWPDILNIPTPGADSFWYENPAGGKAPWKSHFALKDVGNESPMWGDLDGDGRPDLVYNITGWMGYATYDPSKPAEAWTFHPITPKGGYHKYTHGIGFGDINGDRRVDIVESIGWWEHPANAEPGKPWPKHAQKFADAGAQMLVYDVDGDGLADVITAWHCHHYGLVWHKQVRSASGEMSWQQNVILPPEPDLKSDALRFSQPHALDLVDMNGDGLKDVLTGKRFWAHGPKGDKEPNAPAVVYWFELRRDKNKGVQFVPHKIDDNSGVGTQVAAADLNGDGLPDVIVGNKKGIFVHLSQKAK